jgi:hypothetical protein
MIDSSLDLDDCIGNANGRFVVGNRSFSQSARDVRLDGNDLNALLRKSDGSYVYDFINLDAFIGNDIGRLKMQVSNALRSKTHTH